MSKRRGGGSVSAVQYSPEFEAQYGELCAQVPAEDFAEIFGQSIDERDIYSPILVSIRMAGNDSSAKGVYALPVSHTDPQWYSELTAAVGQMLSLNPKKNKIDVRRYDGSPIEKLTPTQLGLMGETDVYVNDKRYRAPLDAAMIQAAPRMSLNKVQALTDWVDANAADLSAFASNTLKDVPQIALQEKLQDGGEFETKLCAHLEKNVKGPRQESWKELVATYGMDRIAQAADPHQTAELVAKELTNALAQTIKASNDEVTGFYEANKAATVAANAKTTNTKGAMNDKKPAANLRQIWNAPIVNVNENWTDARAMFAELATDAFRCQHLADRIVATVYRQPTVKKVTSKIGAAVGGKRKVGGPNPLAVNLPHHYADSVEPRYYGDYDEAMDTFHGLTGRHLLPSIESVMEKTPLRPISKANSGHVLPSQKETATPRRLVPGLGTGIGAGGNNTQVTLFSPFPPPAKNAEVSLPYDDVDMYEDIACGTCGGNGDGSKEPAAADEEGIFDEADSTSMEKPMPPLLPMDAKLTSPGPSENTSSLASRLPPMLPLDTAAASAPVVGSRLPPMLPLVDTAAGAATPTKTAASKVVANNLQRQSSMPSLVALEAEAEAEDPYPLYAHFQK